MSRLSCALCCAGILRSGNNTPTPNRCHIAKTTPHAVRPIFGCWTKLIGFEPETLKPWKPIPNTTLQELTHTKVAGRANTTDQIAIIALCIRLRRQTNTSMKRQTTASNGKMRYRFKSCWGSAQNESESLPDCISATTLAACVAQLPEPVRARCRPSKSTD